MNLKILFFDKIFTFMCFIPVCETYYRISVSNIVVVLKYFF